MPKLKQSFLTIVIGLALTAGLSYAWTGPTANPPENNAPSPVNVSNLSQIKTGALQVNGFKNIGNSMFVGLTQFKGGTSKESWGTMLPDANGKNYIRGKTIIADGAIGSGNQNLNDRLNNRVGIGTTDPKAKLEIKTNDPLEKEWALRIKDGAGAVPNGYVLTSYTENSVDGLASWAPAQQQIQQTFGFGGMYFQKSNNRWCLQGNPYTGGCSCPAGYNPIEAFYGVSGDNNNISINWCYK